MSEYLINGKKWKCTLCPTVEFVLGASNKWKKEEVLKTND
jgi:hypothetical protein